MKEVLNLILIGATARNNGKLMLENSIIKELESEYCIIALKLQL